MTDNVELSELDRIAWWLSQIRLCAKLGEPESVRFCAWLDQAEAKVAGPKAGYEATLDAAIQGDADALDRVADAAQLYLAAALEAWAPNENTEPGMQRP